MNKTEVEHAILEFLAKNPQEWTATEIYQKLDHRFGENIVRESVRSLSRKKTILQARYKHNLQKYRIGNYLGAEVEELNIIDDILIGRLRENIKSLENSVEIIENRKAKRNEEKGNA